MVECLQNDFNIDAVYVEGYEGNGKRAHILNKKKDQSSVTTN